MDKIMKVEFFNRNTGKTFILPTPYTDRVEACVCGQNYCRDRQQEDGTELFFRVLVEGEYYEPEQEDYDYDEDDCDGDCHRCGLCCEDEDEDEEDNFNWDDPSCQSSCKSDPEEPNFNEMNENEVFHLTDEQAEKLASFLLGF